MNEPEIDETRYLPRRLHLRITRRESAKLFIKYYMVMNFIVFTIFGALLIHCVWNTRSYIRNGNDFWTSYQRNNLNPSDISIYTSLSGIIILLVGVFNLMNNVVILCTLKYGGLRRRLKFTQNFHVTMQAVSFAYSLAPLIKFQGMIVLYPVLFVFLLFNLLNGLVLYMLIRRVVRREIEYMLPLSMMYKHKIEYYGEFLSKLRTPHIMLALTDRNTAQVPDTPISSSNENKMFISK
jgi:hypothetical protein